MQSNDPARKETELTGPDRVRAEALRVAARLFAEKGVHGVSVREIAREVGVSHTLLHLYFGSKDDLLRQLLHQLDASLGAGITGGASPTDATVAAIAALTSDPQQTRVLAAALLEGIVPDRIEMHPSGQLALLELLKRSDMKALDPRIAVMALASMAIGWSVANEWMAQELGYADMPPEELGRNMAEVLRRVIEG
jgi:AcrR family transcriptional regulator